MKNAKKVLTKEEKYAKIVNCIIIARTAYSLTKSDNLYIGNLHKKALRNKGKHAAAKTENPERYYQIFEWSD